MRLGYEQPKQVFWYWYWVAGYLQEVDFTCGMNSQSMFGSYLRVTSCLYVHRDKGKNRSETLALLVKCRCPYFAKKERKQEGNMPLHQCHSLWCLVHPFHLLWMTDCNFNFNRNHYLFVDHGIFWVPHTFPITYFGPFIWTFIDMDESWDGVPSHLTPPGTRLYVIYISWPNSECWKYLEKTTSFGMAIMNPWTKKEMSQL